MRSPPGALHTNMQRRADKAIRRFTLSGMPSQRALGAPSAFAYRGESTGIQPPCDFSRSNERGSHGTEVPRRHSRHRADGRIRSPAYRTRKWGHASLTNTEGVVSGVAESGVAGSGVAGSGATDPTARTVVIKCLPCLMAKIALQGTEPL